MERRPPPQPAPPPPAPREYLPPHWAVPLSLPGVLRPWRSITSQWHANYRWIGTPASRGIVAVVIVDLSKMLPDFCGSGATCADHPTTLDNTLTMLREALELCHLYWQAHPPQVREKLKDKSLAIVEEINHRGICVDVISVEFELRVGGADMRVLGDLIAPMLVSAPGGEPYRRVHNHLTALIMARKTPRRPIPITINAKLQEAPGAITNWHVERFFADIAAFAANSTRIHVGGLHEVVSAAFRLSRVYISVDAIPITPWVVQRVVELVKVQSNLVTFEKFTLDPRMFTCGEDDAQRLVKAVTETTPQVQLSTGDIPPHDYDHQAEEQHEEVSPDRLMDLLQCILGAIATAKSIGILDLSLLMFLLPKRQKRKLVWKALADCFSRATHVVEAAAHPIGDLVINAPIKLDVDDAKMIRCERQRNGKQGRRVRSVSFDVKECTDASLLELASLFVGLESLSLSRHQGTFTAAFLLRIVKRAPSLHSLEIDRLKIDCAATVNELVHAAPWQSLSMTDVEISDASVVFKFLHDLGNPTCRLAKSLRVLQLSSRTNSMAVCNQAVLMLAKALGTNQVLQELHITVQNNVSPAAIDAVRCHRGDLLRQPQPRERAAFLSVLNHIHGGHPLLRIDDHIAATIFDFSAILRRRRVTVKLVPMPPRTGPGDTD